MEEKTGIPYKLYAKPLVVCVHGTAVTFEVSDKVAIVC